MQLRDDGNGKQIPYPNMWNFIGGKVEAEETHAEAGVREVYEETEIRIAPDMLKLIFVHDHDLVVDDHLFICHMPEATSEVCHEGAEMEWLSLKEIKELDLGFEQARSLPTLEKYFESHEG